MARDSGNLAVFVMIYLLGVTAVALRWGRFASAVSVALSALAFDYFFETPRFMMRISDWPNFLVFFGMLGIAQVVAGLVHQLRGQARTAISKERETAALYALSRTLAQEAHSDSLIHSVEAFFETGLGLQVQIQLEDRGEDLKDGRAAIELLGSQKRLGSLLIAGETGDGKPYLEACATQIALALERALLAEAAERAQIEAGTERSRSALLTSVSHDLRTPLSTIGGAAAALSLDGDRIPPEERQDLADLILQECRRLDHLIGNLLEITRLEHGGVRLSKEWLPIEEIVGAVLSRLESLTGGIRIETDIPIDLPMVPMDGILVEQLLINLLENALRHAPGTPVTLSAEAAPGAIRMEVRDQGPGIPAADRHRVFEKFHRRSGAPGDGGTGLGLAICKAIVEAHGGRIWVEEAPGSGASFRFTLPLPEHASSYPAGAHE
jgi:two-component system sensor histidine kinase KdpD